MSLCVPGRTSTVPEVGGPEEGAFGIFWLGSPRLVDGPSGPQFSHLYQLWLLRLMVFGSVGLGQGQVDSAGKRGTEDTSRMPMVPGAVSAPLGATLVAIAQGLPLTKECGAQVRDPCQQVCKYPGFRAPGEGQC